MRAEGGSARVAAATQLVESLGGTVESFYFACGGNDAYVVADFADTVSAAAAGLAVSSGGGATTRTVVLLTAQEVDAAAAKSARDVNCQRLMTSVRSAPRSAHQPSVTSGRPGAPAPAALSSSANSPCR